MPKSRRTETGDSDTGLQPSRSISVISASLSTSGLVFMLPPRVSDDMREIAFLNPMAFNRDSVNRSVHSSSNASSAACPSSGLGKCRPCRDRRLGRTCAKPGRNRVPAARQIDTGGGADQRYRKPRRAGSGRMRPVARPNHGPSPDRSAPGRRPIVERHAPSGHGQWRHFLQPRTTRTSRRALLLKPLSASASVKGLADRDIGSELRQGVHGVWRLSAARWAGAATGQDRAGRIPAPAIRERKDFLKPFGPRTLSTAFLVASLPVPAVVVQRDERHWRDRDRFLADPFQIIR